MALDIDTIAEARAEIAQIYIAAFNRVPDAAGLSNWLNQYTAGLMTYAQIAEDFTNQAEYQAKYPSLMTNTEYVTEIYQNVFGRTPDAGGLTNWTNQLDHTSITGINRGNIMKLMLDAAGATGNTDGERLDNQASFAVQSILDGISTDTATAQLANITSDSATVATALTAATTANAVGTTYPLTIDIDTITGTSGNDTITALLNTATTTTMTGLDSVDGGAGNDTMDINVLATATALPVITVSNVETANVRAAAALGAVGVNDTLNDGNNANDNGTATSSADFSSYTGLTTVNMTQGTSASLKAAATTDVNVSGLTDAIEVAGGKNVTVTDATANKNITVGSYVAAAADNNNTAAGSAGAISVTDSNQGTGVILVDGGTTVTVNATSAKSSTGAITVGSQKAASGDVVVNKTVTSDGSAAATTAGNISVTGGSTVTVNSTVTNTATTGNGNNVTASNIAVTGDSKTTAVTVNQTMTATDLAAVTTGNVTESASITFKALKSGDAITISVNNNATADAGELKFTAAKDLTAAEVAAAFANLTATDTQTSGGKVANGVFTGALSAWTSGAANNDTVVFTSTTANTDVTNIETVLTNTSGSSTAPAAPTVTAGSAGTTVAAQDVTADYGTVTINDNATAAIKSITLNGYDNSTAGAGVAVNALTDLTLKNSAGTMGVTTTVASLNMNVDNVTHGVTLTDANLKTLNVATSGQNSNIALVANAVETLAVSGTKSVTLSSDLIALKTVTVTGTAGLDLAAATSNTVTSINTTGTTGTVTASIDASAATYAGGAGVDNVTLTSTTVDKAVNLGGGNDTLTLANGTTSLTSEMIAGDGTDTLVMKGADAETASASAAFELKITGFEKLQVEGIVAGQTDTVNLANMDDINYVVAAGSTASVDVLEVQTFSVTNGVTATKTNQTQTINFTDVLVGAAGAGTMTVGGVNVTLANNDTAITIAAKVAQALNGVTAGTTQNVAATAAGNVVTITFDTRDTTFAALALNIGTVTLDGTSAALPANATVGTAYAANDVSITVGGSAVTLIAQDKTAAGTVVAGTGDNTATDVATKIVTQLDLNATYDAAGTSNTNEVVTVKFATAGDKAAITSTLAGGVTLGTITETTKGAIAATTGDLTLTNMANNGTVELTAAAGTTTVTMADATGTADTFNIITKVNAADLDFGTVSVAGVETVNITATDTTPVNTTTGAATISKATLILSDAAVKSVVIDGNSNLDLTAAGASLTSVNASALTGALTFSSAVNSATITGGSAADTLTATGTSQTLIGGAGADVLTGANLTTLTGGAGADTFMMNKPTNVNSYSTITDLSTGDVIDFGSAATVVFKSAGITLASTAVFQDYANAAVNSLGTDTNDVAWFNYSGNTYIVQSGRDHTSTADFGNGVDSIIKISGVVDLSTASYNQTNATLEVVIA